MFNLRKILISAFSLFVITFLTISVEAKVKPAKLEELIKGSELIVVGKVTTTSLIEKVKFANVEVLQTLKGASYTNIYYSAEKTWACDISNAVNGETALFFFDRYKINPLFVSEGQKPPPFAKTIAFKEAVDALTNNADLFRLTFDGRGRMPIEETDGEKLLKITGSVIVPKDLKLEFAEVINFTNKVLSNN